MRNIWAHIEILYVLNTQNDLSLELFAVIFYGTQYVIEDAT
jgi:hypothetical protein